MENNKLNSFMSPKAGMAFVVLVVVALITSVLTFVTSGSKGAEVGWGILFAILIVGLIFSSFALYLSTRLVKVPEGSFARAMVFNSGVTLILGILASLLILAGLPIALVFVINIVILIALVRWYYNVSVMRSFGIFLVDMVISGIMAFIIFIVTAALGLGILMSIFTGFSKDVDKSVTDYNLPATNVLPVGQENSQNIAPNDASSDVVANSGTTLTSSQVAQVKKMFPVGFPFPSDAKIQFSENKDFAGQYDLKYMVSGDFKTTAATYASIFKKAGYEVASDFNQDLSGVVSAVNNDTGRNFKVWVTKPFDSSKAGTTEVEISTFVW